MAQSEGFTTIDGTWGIERENYGNHSRV